MVSDSINLVNGYLGLNSHRSLLFLVFSITILSWHEYVTVKV